MALRSAPYRARVKPVFFRNVVQKPRQHCCFYRVMYFSVLGHQPRNFIRLALCYYLARKGRRESEVENLGPSRLGGLCLRPSSEISLVRLHSPLNRPDIGAWRPGSQSEQKAFLVRRTPHISRFQSPSIFCSLESAPGGCRWDAPRILPTCSAHEEPSR